MLPFKHPFTSIVSGPTGCGKTNFVMRLIKNVDTMIVPTPSKIVYYFGEYQPLFERYDRVDFRHGMPKVIEIETLADALVVLDDMMDDLDARVTNVFTRGSHHRNVSVVFMVQNFFNKNKHMRTISLNAQYIVLFKNPRDNSQFTHLAKQLYPHNSRFAQEAYVDATREPFGYLLLDLRSEQDEELRLRTHIFPGERQVVYVPSLKSAVATRNASVRETQRVKMSRQIQQFFPCLLYTSDAADE